MKKELLTIVLLCCMCGCMNREVADVFVTPNVTGQIGSDTKFLYNPGTYTGSSNGFGGPITVEVQVSELNILSITILECADTNYYPVSSEETTGNSEGITEEEGLENGGYDLEKEEVEIIGALDVLRLQIVELQSIVDVDIQSGATVSSKALVEAVQRALTEAAL